MLSDRKEVTQMDDREAQMMLCLVEGVMSRPTRPCSVSSTKSTGGR
jgi:hypothetical protein